MPLCCAERCFLRKRAIARARPRGCRCRAPRLEYVPPRDDREVAVGDRPVAAAAGRRPSRRGARRAPGCRPPGSGRARSVRSCAALDVADVRRVAVGVALRVDRGRIRAGAVEAVQRVALDCPSRRSGSCPAGDVDRARADRRAVVVRLALVDQLHALGQHGAAARRPVLDLRLELAERVQEVDRVVADRLVRRDELERRPARGERRPDVAQREERAGSPGTGRRARGSCPRGSRSARRSAAGSACRP